ncbi:MAG: hypothetical protein NTZ69_10570 [Bacteroidia bacterium]|nr:hypothetical protein [Bacteroidia bacterium]
MAILFGGLAVLFGDINIQITGTVILLGGTLNRMLHPSFLSDEKLGQAVVAGRCGVFDS